MMIERSAQDRRFDRAAAWAAFVGIGFGALSGLLLLLATLDVVGRVGILDLIEQQSLLIDAGPGAAELLRWGYLADMLGYYLLLVPLMLALEPRVAAALGRSAARLATVAGLFYVALGSLGAVLLATLTPDLLRAASSGGDTEALAFRLLIEGVHRGVWQTLDAITAGTWIILCGVAFLRTGHRLLGWGGIASGCFSLVLSLGWFLEEPVLVLVGLVFLVPVLLWIAGVARELLRSPAPAE
jgi:hypothetical protein